MILLKEKDQDSPNSEQFMTDPALISENLMTEQPKTTLTLVDFRPCKTRT
jgi:hypothetical protein